MERVRHPAQGKLKLWIPERLFSGMEEEGGGEEGRKEKKSFWKVSKVPKESVMHVDRELTPCPLQLLECVPTGLLGVRGPNPNWQLGQEVACQTSQGR